MYCRLTLFSNMRVEIKYKQERTFCYFCCCLLYVYTIVYRINCRQWYFLCKYSVLKVFYLLYDKKHNTIAIISKDFKLLLHKWIQTCILHKKNAVVII